jgi:hypothetical protein
MAWKNLQQLSLADSLTSDHAVPTRNFLEKTSFDVFFLLQPL